MAHRTSWARLGLMGLGWIGLLACSVGACLWDSDTLRTEAKGMPSVIQAITGRFDRFPPLYYEMRLARVEREVVDHPDDLALYDDAAVALDRLGRGGEAIDWMARKLEVIERLEASGADTADHRYRYLANLGTFHAHRWIGAGADRSDLGDLSRARDLIAEAIELNPDAHFGRERYQLLAIDWLLNPPEVQEYDSVPTFFEADPEINEQGYGNSRRLMLRKYEDAPTGLSGLVTLGNAWQSADLFNTLDTFLYARRDASMALLARLRRDEVLAAGGSTLVPIPEGIETKWSSPRAVYDSQVSAITDYYAKARQEADGWVDARNAYATKRLVRGEHPDTHPEFWSDWSEPSRSPSMPDGVLGYMPHQLGYAGAVVAFAAFVVVVPWGTVRLLRRARIGSAAAKARYGSA